MGRVRRTDPPRLRAATRPRLLTALLATVVLTGTTAASCGDEESPVALAPVSRAAVAEVIDAPATVTARAAATLTAP
ncbi:efflux transporter periplasmic adaptor subunit, partial [Micromonospora phytophila]|nr:efflux transporter periplasmic adaptor subunit [Micromonospora phytophila]